MANKKADKATAESPGAGDAAPAADDTSPVTGPTSDQSKADAQTPDEAKDDETPSLESIEEVGTDAAGDDEVIIVHKPAVDVYVTPKVTQSARIGAQWFSFAAGVRILVPEAIVDHLRRCDII